MSKVSFLFVLLLVITVKGQILTAATHCLGNCSTCDPLDLAQCSGPQPCEWGFYDPKQNGICIASPSTQLISNELGQRSNNAQKLVAQNWSFSSKQSRCEYASSSGLKYLDVIGLFSGVQMVEKIFKVDPSSQLFEVSFNILHDQWLPLNDFLIVDLSSNNKNIQTMEISYDKKVNMNLHQVVIDCEGKKVISQKYKIMVQNNGNIKGDLTIIFTSFLFNAFWGLTNVKVLSACKGYSMFDSASEQCGKCDSDSFVVSSGPTQWCERCPLLCNTCESKKKCLTCVSGAAVGTDGLCSFGDGFKTQMMPINTSNSFCDGLPVKVGSQKSVVSLGPLRNDKNILYDQIQVGFIVYYNPSKWQPPQKLALLVKLNQIEVMRLDYKNLTNQAVAKCSVFGSNMARINIFSDKIVHSDNVISLEWSLLGGKGEFGVGDVRVKSIKKASKPPPPPPKPTPPAQANTTTPTENSQPDPPKGTKPAYNNTVPPENNSTISNSTPPTNPTAPNAVNNTHINQEGPPNTPTSTSPVAPSPSTPPQISYMPTISNKGAGIEVSMSNQPQTDNSYYSVSIDKLSPDQYILDSYYVQNGKLNLFILIQQSFTQGQIKVYRYTTARLLQTTVPSPSLVGGFQVRRFDVLSEEQIKGISGFSMLFTAAAWIAVIVIIIAVMLGQSVVAEEYVLTLQLIFLHVYIASEYLPLTFRDTIGGLNLIQNLNFFISSHRTQIEHQWMGNVVQNGPVRFNLFRTDINFLRQFYPIIIINIIYAIWFLLLFIARKFMNRDLIEEEKGVVNKFLDKIAGRFVNTADQIWRYQFLATVWICFVQFYNFGYPSGSNRNQGINATICIFAFLCSLAWPVFVTFYTRKDYYQCEYSQFLYYFEDLYFLKIPQYELPSNHHRMGYPILRAFKIFLTALSICYFGNLPSLALVVLILLNIVELIYIKIHEIYNQEKYFFQKCLQNIAFVVIDLLLLALLNFSSFASNESYVYIGFVLAGIAFLSVLNSLVRTGYLCHKKYLQAIEDDDDYVMAEKKPRTTRVV